MSAPAPWPEDATRDLLVGDWFIYQRKRGHRASTDDLLTAWFALRSVGEAPVERYLDLGCGIGAVLLTAAHAIRPAESIGVEAQVQSVTMARRTIAELPDPPSVRVIHSDFREVTVERVGRFPLITGSPPYLPLGTGVVSPDPQRAACRFELRGGVEAYCATAARLLTGDGAFCVVFQSQWDERVLDAGEEVGLHLHARADIATRGNPDKPFLSVYRFAAAPAPEVDAMRLAVRDDDGQVTPEWQAVRSELGLPPQR